MPEDDPAGYYYFFNSGGRRRCYVAPERFYSDYADLDAKTAAVAKKSSLQSSKGEKNNSSMKNIELHKHALEHAAIKLKRRITAGKKEQGESFSSMNHGPQYGIISESMDIFSLGCVIAELFLDGNSPLFDLSKLLKYRTGGEESRSALAIALEKLNDSRISTMIQSMLHHNSNERGTADEYLSRYTAKGDDLERGTGSDSSIIFPLSFDEFLFPFMSKMVLKENASADAKIIAICKNYTDIVENVIGTLILKVGFFLKIG